MKLKISFLIVNLYLATAVFCQVQKPILKKENQQKQIMKKKYKAPSVFVQESSSIIRRIATVPTGTVMFIGYTQKGAGTHRLIHSIREYQQNFGTINLDKNLPPSIELFFQNGGSKCYVISVGNTSSPTELIALMDGLETSKQLDGQIVTIPEATELSKAEFYNMQNALLQSCEKSADRFALLSTFKPSSKLQNDINAFRINTSSSSFGAAYYPWIVYKNKAIPAVGAVAGIFSKTDANRGVWKAPAGLEAKLIGINKLSYAITNADQQVLNGNTGISSVNALKTLANKGHLIWGSRTLESNGLHYKYIPVRRLAIMINSSIEAGLTWVVFEPNDANLWANVTQSIEQFLNELWRQGAFQGSKKADSFFVKCGLNETMTSYDINNGVLKVQLGFAPLRPAEFVVLDFEFKMN